MPWLETSSVEQRERFIADERRGLYTRTELCARYGVSRKTGYKWLDRYHEEGRRGLRERSHVPHHCPHRITPDIAGQLFTTPIETLEAELLSLGDEGIDLLTWDDDRFPAHLRALTDAPLVLFVCGTLKRDDEQAVAVVGTRTPGEHALNLASRLSRELASRGLTIVSGLALGIDTAAHRGALEAGRTLAVLGSGIRVIHPRENAELAQAIIGRGALLSELHPNTPPRGPQLMARDRIVSGLSRAVIVVEAGAQSGSLDTAARARKQGRLVYAVPGSAGTEQLIETGARPLDPASADLDLLAAEIANHFPPGQANVSPRQSSLW